MRWASTIDRDAVTERGLEIGCDEVILPLRLKPKRRCDADHVPGIGPMHGRRIEVGAEVRLEGGKASVTEHRLERGRPAADVGHPGEDGRAHPGRRGGAGHQEDSTGRDYCPDEECSDYSGIHGWDIPTGPLAISSSRGTVRPRLRRRRGAGMHLAIQGLKKRGEERVPLSGNAPGSFGVHTRFEVEQFLPDMIGCVQDATAPFPCLQKRPRDPDRAHSVQVVRINEYPGLQGPRGDTRAVPVRTDGVDDAHDTVFGVVDGPKEGLRHPCPLFFVGDARFFFEGARYVVEESGRDEDRHIRAFAGADHLAEAHDSRGMVKPVGPRALKRRPDVLTH
jgi:hypothetical protein